MKIALQQLSGKLSEVQVDACGTLGDLRMAIQKTTCVPERCCFSIARNGQTLEDHMVSSSLKHLGITENTTLTLVLNTFSLAEQLGQLTARSIKAESVAAEVTFGQWLGLKNDKINDIMLACRTRATEQYDSLTLQVFEVTPETSAEWTNSVLYGLNQAESLGSRKDFLVRELQADLNAMGFSSVSVHDIGHCGGDWKCVVVLQWQKVNRAETGPFTSFAAELGALTAKAVDSDKTAEQTLATWNSLKAEIMSEIEVGCFERANSQYDDFSMQVFEVTASTCVEWTNSVTYGLNHAESLGSRKDFLVRELRADLNAMDFLSVSFRDTVHTDGSWKCVVALQWQKVNYKETGPTTSFVAELGALTAKSVDADKTAEQTLATWNSLKAEIMGKIEVGCFERASSQYDNFSMQVFEVTESTLVEWTNSVRYGLNHAESLGSLKDFLLRELQADLNAMGFSSVSISDRAYLDGDPYQPIQYGIHRCVVTLKWQITD